jgi:hypothetical protein
MVSLIDEKINQNKRKQEDGLVGGSELLREDVLADILRRLAPRWLATSRRVCRAWRATVDNRRLLSSVAGIFIKTNLGSFLLARPSVISPYLDYRLVRLAGGWCSFVLREKSTAGWLLMADLL